MIVLFSVFTLMLVLSFVLPSDTDKQWRHKLFWTFLPLFLLGALRVDFGNDYPEYEIIYNEHHNVSSFVFDETAHSEIGFQILCYIMPSFRLLLVLNSLALCLALGLFIYKNVPKEYLWLAILLIFLNVDKVVYGSLVGMRNGFAVIIFLFGVVFIQNRRIIPFVFMTIIAFSMHTSALFYMPIAYLAGRNTIPKKKELMIWVILMLVFAVIPQSILIQLSGPIVSNYFDRYESYMDTYSQTKFSATLLYLSSLVLGLMMLKILWDKRMDLTGTQLSLFRLGLLYVFSNFWGLMTGRATYFYIMFFITTAIGMFKQRKKNSLLELALIILVIAVSAYSFNIWYSKVAMNPNYRVYHSILETL